MAAVWANKPEVGEKIEFLVDHSGPFKTVGEIQAVAGQPGLGAIALDGLWFLRRNAVTLEAPAGPAGVGMEGLQAANNLRLVSAGTWGDEVSEAGQMLAERSPGTSLDAAIADLGGHTADLSDLLKENGV